MVNLVLDEAGFSNAGLQLEGVLIPVGSSRHNGSLTNLAHHQNLCIMLLRQHVQSSSQAPVICGRSKALHAHLFAMSASGQTQLIQTEWSDQQCKAQHMCRPGEWQQMGAGGRGSAEDKGIGFLIRAGGRGRGQGQGAGAGQGQEQQAQL